jgi:hypothetical protein
MFDGFAEWLAGITWPLVSRVLASIGLGTVTYTGATTAIDGALNAASTALNGLSGDLASIMVRAGFFDAMAITAGGLVSGIGWLVLKRFALNAGAPQ